MPQPGAEPRVVVIDAIARSASLVLVALLCLAVGHKLQVLRAGRAHEQPLLRRRECSPALAATLLAGAALVETAVAVAVVVAPAVGLVALVALLLAYTRELRGLEPDEPCACFGELLDRAGRAHAVRRNLALVAVAALAGSAYLSGAASRTGPTQVTIGLAALVLAVILARAALQRQFTTRQQQLGETS